MKKGTRVVTCLGKGVSTGRFNQTPQRNAWTRAEVKLDEIPEHHDKKLLWFFKRDFIPKITTTEGYGGAEDDEEGFEYC